jgi:predicted component of type VI protein secretion system
MFENESQAVESAGRVLMDHRPPTVSEKLEQEKKELELRLEAVTSLIASLDESPNVRDIIDRLSQLGHRVY